MKNFLLFIFLFAFSFVSTAQLFPKIAFKLGATISNQIRSPQLFATTERSQPGIAASIEPTFVSFGRHKKWDFNCDFVFAQKGGPTTNPYYELDQFGQMRITGITSHNVVLGYASVSPNLKINFLKILFFKIGPRVDFLTYYNIQESGDPKYDKRTIKDFDSVTWGSTFSVGLTTGKARQKITLELVGHNDFSDSSYNSVTGQSFKNYCFIFNLGAVFFLGHDTSCNCPKG